MAILDSISPQCYSFSEYITSLAVTTDRAAVATAAGEVFLIPGEQVLEGEDPIGVVAFSSDGSWLSAAGQGGKVWIWRDGQLQQTLDQGDTWIDHLAWHPRLGEFAFSLGRHLQIWSTEIQDIVHTIDFENSAIRALAWHPTGEWLTAGGYQGIKSWNRSDWLDDPICFDLPTAAEAVAWSPQGQYLAAATIDGLVIIFDWLDDRFGDFPWRLHGFPGKIRGIKWFTEQKLVTWSGTEIVIWKLHPDPIVGWQPTVLEGHTDWVNDVSCHGAKNLLASGGKDGLVLVWQGKQLLQTLSVQEEISCLTWQKDSLLVGTIEGKVWQWQIDTKRKDKE